MADKLIPLAKNLRKQATDTERLVWKHLRAKHFKGLKFRRQQPRGKYIVDFVCLVLRFWDDEVLMNTRGMLEVIRTHCFQPPSPQSPPIKGGGE